MRIVNLYPLLLHDGYIEMPRGAKILGVQTHLGDAIICALVETTEPLHKRHFAAFEIGQEVPFDVFFERTSWSAGYIGSFQRAEDGAVLHVFEVVG